MATGSMRHFVLRVLRCTSVGIIRAGVGGVKGWSPNIPHAPARHHRPGPPCGAKQRVEKSVAEGSIENPILNGPYEAPTRHFEIAVSDGITGTVITGRRPSESFIPIRAHQDGQEEQSSPGRPRLRRHGRTPGAELVDQRQPRRGRTLASPPVSGRHSLRPGVTPCTREFLQYRTAPGGREEPRLSTGESPCNLVVHHLSRLHLADENSSSTNVPSPTNRTVKSP